MIAPPKPLTPEPGYLGVFYAYIRVSHHEQVESGLSIEAQKTQTRARFDYLNAMRDVPLIWGEYYIDEAQSAFKYRFIQRNAGGKLHARLRPGDHVCIAKVDRGFRDTKDALDMCRDLWPQLGVTAHFLDLGVDTSTATGRLFLTLLAAIAEWDSARKSERVRDALAARWAQGKATSGKMPIGKRRNRAGFEAPSIEDISLMQLAVALRDAGGSWEDIALLLNACGIQLAKHRRQRGVTLGHKTIKRFYDTAIAEGLEPSLNYFERFGGAERISKLGRKHRELIDAARRLTAAISPESA